MEYTFIKVVKNSTPADTNVDYTIPTEPNIVPN
jgi:hypothetical protein